MIGDPVEQREVEVWLEEAAKCSGEKLSDLREGIQKQAKRVLLPSPDNFTPPSRTPWGGYEILSSFKNHLGIRSEGKVGESWEISRHESFPNRFPLEIAGKKFVIPIHLLEVLAIRELYGEGESMPFLVKLLNSGSLKKEKQQLTQLLGTSNQIARLNNHRLHMELEGFHHHSELRKLHQEMIEKNLSIQVHPKKGYHPKYPSKDEVWVILEAEKGAGIYLGLKEESSAEMVQSALAQGTDPSNLLNFVEVKPGEAFSIPSGTLHAVGAGILLLEAQESSESTFRAYDWGRLYQGKPRQLHVEEALKAADWTAAKGNRLIEQLRCKPVTLLSSSATSLELIKATHDFSLMRVQLKCKGEAYKSTTVGKGVKGVVVTEGGAHISDGNEGENEGIVVQKGQSFLLPAAMGAFSFTSTHPNTTLYVVEPASMKSLAAS